VKLVRQVRVMQRFADRGMCWALLTDQPLPSEDVRILAEQGIHAVNVVDMNIQVEDPRRVRID
jgi:hypothetical protein